MLSTLGVINLQSHRQDASPGSRRGSMPFRPPYQLAMDEYRFGTASSSPGQDEGSASQDSLACPSTSSRPSSSMHHQPHSSSSSSRRASLPLFISSAAVAHPYRLPSPRSSTFRHRPSISSVTTNGTSTSTSTATNNDESVSFLRQDNAASLEPSGIYRDLQSYVFGGTGQPTSTNLHPGPSSLRNARRLSRQSSSATSMGITVGAAMRNSSILNDDSDMNDNSDVGSAYSPEDDGVVVGSQRRWDRSAAAADHDRMDVDLDRRLSRDLSTVQQLLEDRRGSPRSQEKKRERNGHNRQAPGAGVGPELTSTMSKNWSSDYVEGNETMTDEDDSNRILERAKMRAIDDGGRRPSLPINIQHHVSSLTSTSLAPLTIVGSHWSRQDDLRSAMLATTASSATPTARSFAQSAASMAEASSPQSQRNLPLSLTMTGFTPTNASSPTSTMSTSSLSTSTSARDIKTRPRSRSNRNAKALPALPTNAGINPNWVPPWSLANSLPPSSPMSLGLPPPGLNPFLQPLTQGRNPFTTRDRSATVTQSLRVERRTTPTLETVATEPVAEAKKTGPPPPPAVLSSTPSATHAFNTSTTSPSSPPDGGTAATADFDLAFILSSDVLPPTVNHTIGLPPTPGSNGRKASLAGSVEDSFVRFVNKFDDEYGERRDKWSYRPEHRSITSGSGGEYWRNDNMGRYWVGRELGLEDAGLEGFTAENSIVIRACPEEKGKGAAKFTFVSPPPSVSVDGHQGSPTSRVHVRSRSVGSGEDASVFVGTGGSNGPISPTLTPSQRRSNVRVQVKKHARAPAFTLYLGPRAPRSQSGPRPSVLLAPKAYHLHTSIPPKSKVSAVPNATPASPTAAAYPPSDLSHKPPSSSHSSRSRSVGSTVVSSPAVLVGPPPASMHRKAVMNSSSVGEYEMMPLDQVHAGPSRPPVPPPAHSALPPSPPAVSLDFMSVAAATGRMTSSHNHAFDTLSPEDGQAVLEHLKQRSSLGIRIKRAFGGINSGSKDAIGSTSSTQSHSSVHSEPIDGGRDARSTSPHAHGLGIGKHSKDHHGRDDQHHPAGPGALEAAFEPPWMLMTPMYVKEAVIAAERSMYTGFASLGLAAPPHKKNKQPRAASHSSSTVAMSTLRRNSVLDTVPNEAMCMVLPLWDLTLDMEEDKRKRRPIVDDLDLDLDDLEEEHEDDEDEEVVDSMLADAPLDPEVVERKRLAKEFARRRKLMPPPKMERKYLLAYYIPFNAKRQSIGATTHPTASAAASANESRRGPVKKRPRQQNSLRGHPSLNRRKSGTDPSSEADKILPVRSFRVVSRILTPAELRDSGLNPPRNIVDPKRMQQQSTSYYQSSLNYQRMDRRLSSSSIFGEIVPSAFSAVIAVCHDRRKGVEFIPEGLDSLGLCGGETVIGPSGTPEKLPPLFPPAHMVPVSERRTPPLNAVGRQIVEMIWSGCLALTELGI